MTVGTLCRRVQAEQKLLGQGNKEYLPIQGLAAFNKATAELLLGADNAAIKEVGQFPPRRDLTTWRYFC